MIRLTSIIALLCTIAITANGRQNQTEKERQARMFADSLRQILQNNCRMEPVEIATIPNMVSRQMREVETFISDITNPNPPTYSDAEIWKFASKNFSDSANIYVLRSCNPGTQAEPFSVIRYFEYLKYVDQQYDVQIKWAEEIEINHTRCSPTSEYYSDRGIYIGLSTHQFYARFCAGQLDRVREFGQKIQEPDLSSNFINIENSRREVQRQIDNGACYIDWTRKLFEFMIVGEYPHIKIKIINIKSESCEVYSR